MQVCQCAGVQVCRCEGMQVRRCAGVQGCRCAGVQVCRCAPSGTTSGKGLYFSVYPLSCPNTDTVHTRAPENLKLAGN